MNQINAYWQQLTDDQISRGDHRNLIGGLWHELGKLQFSFMVEAGLRPDHKLCDVGCGPREAACTSSTTWNRAMMSALTSTPRS